MNNELEYNFIQNQIEANTQISAVLQNEIATLLNLVHQKRQWIDQIENNNHQLTLRANSFNEKDKTLVKHYNG